MVLAIPLTLYTALNLKPKNTITKAAVPEDSIIVTIDGVNYTKAQIRQIAEEQIDPTAVTQEDLQVALDVLIERKILDKAASDYNIAPDPDRVAKYKQDELSDTEAKYEALRDQIILKAVNSAEVESIGFWNPPASGIGGLSTQEQTLAAQQLTSGNSALDEIQTRMQNDENALDIADDILASNLDLADVLAVNGYIVSTLNQQDRAYASYPTIQEYGDNAYDDQIENEVFNIMNEGEVKKVTNTTDNRGGSVFKIVKRGNVNGSGSYDSWLTERKAALVQTLNQL